MKALTILCTRPRRWKLGSCLIRRIQKLEFSHVALSTLDTRLQIRKVYESKSPIAQMSAISRFTDVNLIVEAYVVPTEDLAVIYAEVRAIMGLGGKYGFKSLLGHLCRVLFGHFPSWADDDNRTSVCVEYLVRALNIQELDPDRVDLVQFRRWLQKNGRIVPVHVIEDLNGR